MSANPDDRRVHGQMKPAPESSNLQDYLNSTEVIDWCTPEVHQAAVSLSEGAPADVEKAKRLYEWVRGAIPHSADAGHETVTCRASQVLQKRTGICYAKAHLLAAMLRATGIPAGMCYQVLRYDDSSDRLVLHGLNGIYLESLGKWLRVDPRGNKPGVDAQFSVDEERLAFSVDPTLGEFDCPTVFAEPLASVEHCLTVWEKVTDLMANLPETLNAE